MCLTSKDLSTIAQEAMGESRKDDIALSLEAIFPISTGKLEIGRKRRP